MVYSRPSIFRGNYSSDESCFLHLGDYLKWKPALTVIVKHMRRYFLLRKPPDHVSGLHLFLCQIKIKIYDLFLLLWLLWHIYESSPNRHIA